jgi:5-methyltetrahydropteroyltriglutamate--homocysteine methyltransferase
MGHPFTPKASFDGGDLDCGNGLLLLIRRHIDPLAPGELLEIRSRELSVDEELPAWCRMTGNELVSRFREGKEASFLVSKGPFRAAGTLPRSERISASPPVGPAPAQPSSLAVKSDAPQVAPLSVMGIGSWPRPRWMLQALHEHLERRLSDDDFERTADDAVRLAVDAQRAAGVDVLTDGEQRRDNYASFVGGLLGGCQLVPITDLLPYVDDPQEFAAELRALDVPAERVRHPAVFGPIRRTRSLAVHELRFVQGLAPGAAVKVALPGPYLLSRTMFLECITERAYATREQLAADVVTALRAEVMELLDAGAAIVQLDEPVLSEVVFGTPKVQRSFMCGALGARKEPGHELGFALELLSAVTLDLPRERLAIHVCRGNWTPDESVALSGDYRPLLPLLQQAPVGTIFLELATPRAGEMALLRGLPAEKRIGVGLVNQKHPEVETLDEVLHRARQAMALLGRDRLLFTPDCGFATFADNPLASEAVAAAKLRVIAEAARRLRDTGGQ